MNEKFKDWYQRIPGEKFIHPIPKHPQEIYGYCNFQNIYSNIVNSSVDGAVFVEIGSMAGLSAAWMAAFIENSRKNIEFYSIDSLPDVYGEESLGMYGQEFDVPMYQLFLRNLKSLNLLRYVTHIRLGSVEASTLFDNNSVDFIFIDGDHTTPGVLADIDAWKPKLKKNGIMAGHDYDHTTVREAVNQRFSKIEIKVNGTSWIVGQRQNDPSIKVSDLDFSLLDEK